MIRKIKAELTDDKELNARINYNKGVALASMVCLQQLLRVVQERKVLTTQDLQDVLSEALANFKLNEPKDENEAAVDAFAIRTIKQFFAD